MQPEHDPPPPLTQEEHELVSKLFSELLDLSEDERAAVFACPAGARPEVRERADIVTEAHAGAGAVRELIEAMLDAKGLWQARLERYSRPAE